MKKKLKAKELKAYTSGGIALYEQAHPGGTLIITRLVGANVKALTIARSEAPYLFEILKEYLNE